MNALRQTNEDPKERLDSLRFFRGIIKARDQEIARGLRLLTQDQRQLHQHARWALARIAHDKVFHTRLLQFRATVNLKPNYHLPILPNGLLNARLANDPEVCLNLFGGCFKNRDALTAAYLTLRILDSPVYEPALFNVLSAGGIATNELNLDEFRRTLENSKLIQILYPQLPETRTCPQCRAHMHLGQQDHSYFFYECTRTIECKSEAVFLTNIYQLARLHPRSKAAQHNNKLYDRWIGSTRLTVGIQLGDFDKVRECIRLARNSAELANTVAPCYRNRYQPNFKTRGRVHRQVHPGLLEELVAAGRSHTHLAERWKIGATRLQQLLKNDPALKTAVSRGLGRQSALVKTITPQPEDEPLRRPKIDDDLIIYGPDFGFIILREHLRGRPRQATIDHRKVEHLLARGFKMHQVAARLGTNTATLYHRAAKDVGLRSAIKNGRKRSGHYLARTLMNEAQRTYVPNFIILKSIRGRPESHIDAERLEQLLAKGLKMETVVRILRTSRGAVYRKSQHDPILKNAIINGRKKGGTLTKAGGKRSKNIKQLAAVVL